PTPPNALYTLSLHDALPIYRVQCLRRRSESAAVEHRPERRILGSEPPHAHARDAERAGAEDLVVGGRGVQEPDDVARRVGVVPRDRKSTRLNSSHVAISYAV